ncbi:hypothetical protein MLD38_008870 [Melastoma candidum]|uniref:Uncharacterized protein n=1 Tax=Melastoma candidum TaxID=119954 RepID=A0ACB9S028_9MYRT|nr:hypothetical protein MLD38_008870 [Melastoma candidum]
MPQTTGDLDIHNIYALLFHSSNLITLPKKASLENFDLCRDNYVYAYLNRPEVQQALHVNVTKLSINECSMRMYHHSPAS